ATRPLSDRHAVDVWLEHVRSRPGEVTLVTCGPLTTLAGALKREPESPRLLRRWVVMGGAYRVPGNTAPTTEWNIHCDPEAATLASAAPWPARPIALGLDVTEKAKILPAPVVDLAWRAGSPPADS